MWQKKRKDTEKHFLDEANVWLGKHRRSFGFSILSFILASGVMAIGLALSVEVTPPKN